MKSYICVLSTDNYLDGVLVLNENLKALKSKYNLICLINENISKEARKKLQQYKINYKEMKSIPYSYSYEKLQHWKYTFDKINIFSLEEYEKLVYLDLDLLILENIDHLFLEPAPSMPLDLPFNLRKYNSGIMVIEPKKKEYEKMLKLVKNSLKQGKKISDQNIINEYYKEINPLPYGYNMVRSILYSKCYMLGEIGYDFVLKNEVQQFIRDSNQNKIIHYIGNLKPFMLENQYDDRYCSLYFYYLGLVKEKEREHRIKNKLISIIIPVYNKEKYLSKCLSSIMNQSYKNLEIILVNDGSTDKSLKICKEFQKKDPRIKLVQLRKNSGVSVARNKGLEIATGDYISFVDSDDEIAYNMYEIQIKDIEKYNADFVQCGALINGKRESIDDRNQFFEGNEYIMQTFLNKSIITPYVWDKMFKREVLKNKKFNEHFLKNEDQQFIFEVVKEAKKLIINNQPLYQYTYAKKDSLTKEFSFARDGCKLIYLNELKKYIDENYPNLRSSLDQYLAFEYYGMLFDLVKSNRVEQELSDIKIFITIVETHFKERKPQVPDYYIREVKDMIKRIKRKTDIEDMKIEIKKQENQNRKLISKIEEKQKREQ